jgi:hypothetical protein
MEAAHVVYSWLFDKHVPFRVVGRDAICDVPMRIFRETAEAHPTDPVMRYIRKSQVRRQSASRGRGRGGGAPCYHCIAM